MTLKQHELADIEKTAHGLFGSFDGKPKITAEQMKCLLDSVRHMDAGTFVIRAMRETYARQGGAGFARFLKRAVDRAFEMQRAAREAQGAGRVGNGESPDDIAARWDAVRRRKLEVYGDVMSWQAHDAWLCFAELMQKGSEWAHAEHMAAMVFGEESVERAMGRIRDEPVTAPAPEWAPVKEGSGT